MIGAVKPFGAKPIVTQCWLREGEREAGSHDVEHSYGDEILPSVTHELVVAEAWQRAAHPDIEKEEAEDLEHEGQDRQQRVDEDVLGLRDSKANVPSAEEEQRSNTADGDHVGIFGHEEHGELHGAVLSVVAAGEFGFRFRKIEGSAVGFSIRGGEVDEE